MKNQLARALRFFILFHIVLCGARGAQFLLFSQTRTPLLHAQFHRNARCPVSLDCLYCLRKILSCLLPIEAHGRGAVVQLTSYRDVCVNVQFVHHCVFPVRKDCEVPARGLVFQRSLVVQLLVGTTQLKLRPPSTDQILGQGPSSSLHKLEHVLGLRNMEAATTHMMGCLPGMLLQTTTLGSQRISAAKSRVSGSGDFARFGVRARSGASSRVACKASTAVSFTDKFDSTQQAQWQTCRHLVEELGFSSDEANDILAKSFGWSYSDYWGEEKQATVPESETVSASVALIKSLGVDMAALVKKFPEVMGLSEREIQYSLGTLDGTWGIAGKNLKNVLLRNPQVLGFNIDCGGDCAGECSRCWVRF